jgi:RHS repeat-associated protein
VPVILQDSVGGSVSGTYIYGRGLLSSVYPNGYRNFRLSDGLGSTQAIADSTGAIVTYWAYEAFGAVRVQLGPSASQFLFAGEQRDSESLFDYLRARYYDPAIGRFLSADPLGGGYPYVGNNPVNMVDPSGLYPICGLDDPALGPGLQCFDSTEVGLPAELPSSCDVHTNTCYWDNGTTADYNLNPNEELVKLAQGAAAESNGANSVADLVAAEAVAVNGGSAMANATAGCGGPCARLASCHADRLFGIGCIHEINDIVDAITGECGRAILNEVNEELILGILQIAGANGKVPAALSVADAIESGTSIGLAC